ncbi:MAG TPA: glycosyltransferase family 39 protein [Xanthobacteraceae bacterium]|nr:glycosyltransferase family 39 protein [Xanthobacteraceae bacterium]
MLYVSILVELLRARPALTVLIAAGAQAAVWTLVPALFYAGPPGNLPAVLAVGHEFQLGTYLGPPLAFWLAEVAFRMTGRSLFAIYALSQICVVLTYWAVFRLGRAIVGAQQAALAVLLMVGISTFTVATPEFGPVVLTMPLWAMTLLHYWLAVAEKRPRYALALALDVGLILLTTYAGVVLIGLLVLFTCVNARTRPMLRSPNLWPAGAAAVVLLIPHLYWVVTNNNELLPALARLRAPDSVAGNLTAWLRQLLLLLGAHAGLIVLIAIVIGSPRAKREPAPVIMRRPVEPFGRQFVYFFATMPPLLATVAGVVVGSPGPLGGIAPLLVLSGLAVVIAAGDAIALSHQRAVIAAWFGLLFIPPTLAVVALLTLPWLGIDLAVNQPAAAMARFFADSFARRVGKELPIVAGDPRTAALVELGAASRPSLFLEATPARSPWVSMHDIRAKGAIVVWPTTDTAGTPPPAIREDFPDIVPEVPRAFERTVQGRLPLLRIGWALIRPQLPPDAPAAADPQP